MQFVKGQHTDKSSLALRAEFHAALGLPALSLGCLVHLLIGLLDPKCPSQAQARVQQVRTLPQAQNQSGGGASNSGIQKNQVSIIYIFLKSRVRGAWVAQRPTSAQVMIPRFVGSSPMLGSGLTARSLEPAWDSVSLSLFLPHSCSLSLSLSLSLCLSKINKQ